MNNFRLRYATERGHVCFWVYRRHQSLSISHLVIPSIAILQRNPYRFSPLWKCDRPHYPLWCWCDVPSPNESANAELPYPWILSPIVPTLQQSIHKLLQLQCAQWSSRSLKYVIERDHRIRQLQTLSLASMLPHQVKASDAIPHSVRSDPHPTVEQGNTLLIMLLSILPIAGINNIWIHLFSLVYLSNHRSITFRTFILNMSMIFGCLLI